MSDRWWPSSHARIGPAPHTLSLLLQAGTGGLLRVVKLLGFYRCLSLDTPAEKGYGYQVSSSRHARPSRQPVLSAPEAQAIIMAARMGAAPNQIIGG